MGANRDNGEALKLVNSIRLISFYSHAPDGSIVKLGTLTIGQKASRLTELTKRSPFGLLQSRSASQEAHRQEQSHFVAIHLKW